MDFSLLVDCGAYATKYVGQAKRNRRKDWADSQVKEVASLPGDARERWLSTLTQLVSSEVEEKEELSLVLVTDVFACKTLRECLLHAAFERFGAKKVAMCTSASAALVAGGATSGVTVDVGYSSVRLTPVDRGVPLASLAASLTSVGSAAVDSALFALWGKKLDSTVPTKDVLAALARNRAKVSSVKASFCHIGSVLASDALSEDAPLPLSLPDGKTLVLPAVSDSEWEGVTESLLYSSRSSVPNTFAHIFQKSVIAHPDGAQWLCCGGGSSVPGVSRELSVALTGQLFSSTPRQLVAKNPATAAVDGVTILSHLSSFKSLCISQSEYEEYGPEQCTHVKALDAR